MSPISQAKSSQLTTVVQMKMICSKNSAENLSPYSQQSSPTNSRFAFFQHTAKNSAKREISHNHSYAQTTTTPLPQQAATTNKPKSPQFQYLTPNSSHKQMSTLLSHPKQYFHLLRALGFRCSRYSMDCDFLVLYLLLPLHRPSLGIVRDWGDVDFALQPTGLRGPLLRRCCGRVVLVVHEDLLDCLVDCGVEGI